MICTLARYRIRTGTEEEVLEAVRALVSAVREAEPCTTYRAYRLDDGLSFVHYMVFPDMQAEEQHRQAAYTRRFAERLGPCCEDEPTFNRIETVAAAEIDGRA
jgi:quinol monooxygenase YgiN